MLGIPSMLISKHAHSKLMPSTKMPFHPSFHTQVSGLAMLGCGGFYTFGGLLCIGMCKRSRQRRCELACARSVNWHVQEV